MANERLILLTGPEAGRVYEIDGPLTIGRNFDNPIRIDDRGVSGRHAVVERDGDAFVIRDLNSHNGTWVGGVRVTGRRLAHGDYIRIGHQEFRFECGASRPPEGAEDPTATWRGVRFEDGVQGAFRATSAESLYSTIFRSAADGATAHQLSEAQRRLEAVYKANEIITSERNLDRLFERVMDQIFALVPAHNGVILLKDQDPDEWRQAHVRTGSERRTFTVSKTIVNRAYSHKEAIFTSNAKRDARFESGASVHDLNISSALCAPLLYQGEPLGVVYVDSRGAGSAFAASDLELLVALSGPSAIAIKNAQYLNQIEQSYQDTLVLLADAIELRDHYTVGHTWRVTNIAMLMARELGWSEAKIAEVEMGTVLHDIGKIAVDDSILGKAGGLTSEEFERIKVHPKRGADLLKDVGFLKPLIPYCLYHHERFDGRGYPFGLAGDRIPIEGRLVAVADTFDAMTSTRPYRRALDPEEAAVELERFSGSQFDPACVRALVSCLRAGKIHRVLQGHASKDGKAISCPFCSTYLPVAEQAGAGDGLTCHVCRRAIRLRMENDALFGELLPLPEAPKPHRS